MSPEGISPVRMNGLRMSGPQIKLQQIFPDEGNPRRVPFYQALAADRINISFLCADYSGPVKKLICMAEPATLTRLGGGLTKDSGISGNIDTQAACLISIFPHRFNPAAVGTILHAFSRDNSSWHCMATSGSMVSFVIDHAERRNAADNIARSIELPASHGKDSGNQISGHISRSAAGTAG